MAVQARAGWVREPGVGECRPATVPTPGPTEVLVRTLRTGISRGTETLVFRGGVPADQRAVMRAPSRPPSTRCGMPPRSSATESPWWEPGWWGCVSPACSPASPGPR